MLVFCQVRNHWTARLFCLAVLAAMSVSMPAAFGDTVDKAGLAISRFDFRDTSGEHRDQTAEHARRLEDVAATLLATLSANEKIRPVALNCTNGGCSARTSGLEHLSEAAAAAGARFLLVGEVHKTSTLVGWLKFAVLDLRGKTATCDRFLTYRGDTDEAWHRAAEFAGRDIGRNCIP
jgi:hypothetical protein